MTEVQVMIISSHFFVGDTFDIISTVWAPSTARGPICLELQHVSGSDLLIETVCAATKEAGEAKRELWKSFRREKRMICVGKLDWAEELGCSRVFSVRIIGSSSSLGERGRG